MGWLKKRFSKPLEAERRFSDATTCSSVATCTSTGAQTDFSLDAITELFTKYCAERCGLEVGEDFLRHAVCAMQNLKEAGRLNVIYHLSKSFSVQRSDGSDTLFPRKRMPMGLLEFMSGFFTASDSRNVSVTSGCIFFVNVHLQVRCTCMHGIVPPKEYCILHV